MKGILLLIVSVFLLGCSKNQPQTDNGDLQPVSDEFELILNTDDCRVNNYQQFDHAEINDIEIEHDTLMLTVSYSGGCKEHCFKLTWDGTVIKTLPPKILLNLIHDADFDQCEAYITEIVAFNLAPLNKQLQGQVSAQLVISYGNKVAEPELYTL